MVWVSAIVVSVCCCQLSLSQSYVACSPHNELSQSVWSRLDIGPSTTHIERVMSRSQNEKERAEMQERNLKLDTETRKGIETTLAQLGHEVGPVDGEFDRTTREAIKAFQEEWMFPVTGYIDDVTFGRLLAIGIIH